jgi:hypothetical protein
MSHSAFRSWTSKSFVGLVLLTAGAVGIHGSDAGAIRSSDQIVESLDCRGSRDNGGRADRGHDRSGQDAGDGLKQTISVRVRATTFLRVDALGRVTSAATNTGCRPSNQDDVFLLLPNGTIEQATALHLDDCHWTGDFTVPGQFQPQVCKR